jgi:hypothetical protein
MQSCVLGNEEAGTMNGAAQQGTTGWNQARMCNDINNVIRLIQMIPSSSCLSSHISTLLANHPRSCHRVWLSLVEFAAMRELA